MEWEDSRDKKVKSSVERMDRDVLLFVSSNIKYRVLRSWKDQGKNECREIISSPQLEVGAWISLVKDVVHFKKFAWVQEENEEKFKIKRQFHGRLANKTNHISLKKSELKGALDNSWEGPLLCLFLSQAPASGHYQRHGLEGLWTESAQPFLCSPIQPGIAHCETPLTAYILLCPMIEDFSLCHG